MPWPPWWRWGCGPIWAMRWCALRSSEDRTMQDLIFVGLGLACVVGLLGVVTALARL